jgi:hypothetical protein
MRTAKRQLPFNASAGFDPSTPTTPTAFNWDSKQKDMSMKNSLIATPGWMVTGWFPQQQGQTVRF